VADPNNQLFFRAFSFPSQLLIIETLRRPLESNQYTSLAFGTRCQQAGIRPSRGTVGDCFDNALCESFFATLECELIDRRAFHTQTQARQQLFHYSDGYYNPHRRHSALDYLSPINYEKK